MGTAAVLTIVFVVGFVVSILSCIWLHWVEDGLVRFFPYAEGGANIWCVIFIGGFLLATVVAGIAWAVTRSHNGPR